MSLEDVFLEKLANRLLSRQSKRVVDRLEVVQRGRHPRNMSYDLLDEDEAAIHWYRTVYIPELKANARRLRSFQDSEES